jgi:cytochrome c oxidase cbb3-type subunit 3
MKNSDLVRVLGALLLSASLLAFAGQQDQNATPNPPPQPPAGAANGPQPGPQPKAQQQAEQAPGADKSMQEAMRNFLAIGAPPDPEAVKRGQALFVSNCGFCHGSNAKGGATGPSLVRSVVVLHDGGTAKEITPVVRNGRQAKGMPAFPNLTDAQLKDTAAFLLKRTQAAANRMEYKILNIVTGDPKAGETYFAEHCGSCHSASGDLAHIAGKFDPVALQSRFLYPKTSRYPGMPGPPPDPREQKTVTVTMSSGETYSGTLDHLDDFNVSLTTSNGEHRSWNFDDEKNIKVDVHDPLKAHADLLPGYTDADMHNVLAYLETMK